MKRINDISYGLTGHSSRKLDIYQPDQADHCPVFLYFHGGGLEAGDKKDADVLASYLVPRGILVISANYRMYPEAVYPEYLRDAAAAAAWVKKHAAEYGGDPEQIYPGGSSAGGYITMMLCYDPKYLAPYHLTAHDFAGFIHDAGQPSTHYNILRERGIDSRRVLVDEAAPLYHIGCMNSYPPQMILISNYDMENRPEQTTLLMSTMKHFRYDMSKVKLVELHGSHCEYVCKYDENGDSIFGKLIWSYIIEQTLASKKAN